MNITLIDEKTNKEFEVEARKISYQLMDESEAQRKKILDEAAALDKKYEERLKGNGEDYYNAIVEKNRDIFDLGAKSVVEMAKIMIDKNKLDDKLKKKIESNYRSAFWKIQNLEELGIIAQTFRVTAANNLLRY